MFMLSGCASSRTSWRRPALSGKSCSRVRFRGSGKEDLFYVTVGRVAASDDAALRAFLERLGSRIVFLIDWNRARKRLGLLVPNALAQDLLKWAAEHNLGHRGFSPARRREADL